MPSTIRDLTELTAVAVDDYFLVSDTSDVTNRDKRISRANLLASAVFLSGTPAAGRVASWLNATTVQDGGFAVSDIARLSVAQSYAALNTFAGVNIANGFLILSEAAGTLASDTLTPTASMMRVDTEGGAATDNLFNILAGPADGAILILRSNNGLRDTTIKNGAGTAFVNNIRTSGGVDRLLGSTRERWMAQYYAAAQIWVEISYSANAA